jgi:hypothetical protein
MIVMMTIINAQLLMIKTMMVIECSASNKDNNIFFTYDVCLYSKTLYRFAIKVNGNCFGGLKGAALPLIAKKFWNCE